MSIDTVCAAIAQIMGAMEPIEIAGDVYTIKPKNPPPPKLDTAELPAQYTLTGSATIDEDTVGDEAVLETRMYRLQFPVIPFGQGTAKERETRCRPLLEAVRNHLLKFPGLNYVDETGTRRWVKQAKVLGDSGVALLPDFSSEFIGFEIRLQVIEAIPRTYALYE